MKKQEAVARVEDRKVWNDDRVKILKDLWWRRERAEDIAAVLDTTARSVSRKAQRLDLLRGPIMATPSTIRDVARHKREPIPRVRDDGSPVTMANVRSTDCQWIPGAPGAHAPMCGHRTQKNSRYCEHHHERCFPKEKQSAR